MLLSSYAIILYSLVVTVVIGQPVNTLQSIQVAAQLARRIVSDAGNQNIFKKEIIFIQN